MTDEPTDTDTDTTPEGDTDDAVDEDPVPEPVVDEATVRKVEGDWHLVEYGEWQVSVAPDGLLMLPRHLHPDEVGDFVNAILAAGDVGGRVKARNEKAAESDDRSLPTSTLVVTESGSPTPGSTVKIAAGSTPQPPSRGSIGRRTRNPSTQGLKTAAPEAPRARGARR